MKGCGKPERLHTRKLAKSSVERAARPILVMTDPSRSVAALTNLLSFEIAGLQTAKTEIVLSGERRRTQI